MKTRSHGMTGAPSMHSGIGLQPSSELPPVATTLAHFFTRNTMRCTDFCCAPLRSIPRCLVCPLKPALRRLIGSCRSVNSGGNFLMSRMPSPIPSV